MQIKHRFRGYLPVVVDIETAGFDYQHDAILEIAIVFIKFENNLLKLGKTKAYNILPFAGANINKEALEFNGVRDPFNPLRAALAENEVLQKILPLVENEIKQYKCKKAVLVGHNSWFDLHFLNSAIKRCNLKSPFHSFTSLDTASLGALVYKHTVLAELVKRANINWDNQHAHSAIYDAKKTAQLFCDMVNKFDQLSVLQGA